RGAEGPPFASISTCSSSAASTHTRSSPSRGTSQMAGPVPAGPASTARQPAISTRRDPDAREQLDGRAAEDRSSPLETGDSRAASTPPKARTAAIPAMQRSLRTSWGRVHTARPPFVPPSRPPRRRGSEQRVDERSRNLSRDDGERNRQEREHRE